MKFKLKNISLALCIAIVASGCSLTHTEYERPELAGYEFKNAQELSELNKNGAANETQDKLELNSNLWEIFNDPYLTVLVNKALEVNTDYQQTVIDLKKAMVQADIADTNLIPEISASMGSSVSRALDKHDSTHKKSSSGITLSYEVDLFGKLSAERKESAYKAEAAKYDVQSAKLSLVSNVAKIYWQIVYYKNAVRLGKSNLKDSQDTLDIMSSRYENGDVSQLELLEAKRDLLNTQTALSQYEASLVSSVSAMNVLLKQLPDTPIETAEKLVIPDIPNSVLSFKSEDLAKRPDIASSEASLKSVLASKDVAKLKMYPSFSLSAGIEAGSSDELANFLKNPVGTIAARLAFPFLNYYQRSLDIDVAKLNYDSQEMKFVQSYYTAVGEVYDCLNDIKLNATVLKAEIERKEYNKEIKDLYQSQYDSGKVPLKDLLSAKTSLRKSRLDVYKQRETQLNSIMTLGKAMGGF